ncbi:MAG: indole-3-glycerol phosphate synthase TrpC [Flammeovirgaceae bacterium]
MDILNRIVEQKRIEVAQRKELYPIRLLEQSIYFGSPTVSLKKYVQRSDKSGIIAEIKRQSPSRGVINNHVSVERTSIGYMQAGASALSVLTDKLFFGGSSEDLMTARKYNFCPILRKDFTIDEYQIIEAKSIGADAILLIAAILSPLQIKVLAATAHQLGLEVLLEVHSNDELEKSIDDTIDLIGVNNRNLKTFELDLDISKRLVEAIPSKFVKISESGIESPATIIELKKLGFDGFLMGQNFMQHSRPEEAAKEFIKQLNKINKKK